MHMHNMEAEKIISGPFRATKLWNEAILIFRDGMPVKKHRRRIQFHDDCFTGSEAVVWLQSALQKNPSFGQDVQKDQTIQLLQKFLRAGVFEKITDKNSNTLEQFKDNGNLYKFCSRSPLRDMQLIPNLMSSSKNLKRPEIPQLDSSPKRMSEASSNIMDKTSFLQDVRSKAEHKLRNQLEVEEVWKSVLLGRLEALLERLNVEKLLPPELVSGSWISQNADTAGQVEPLPLANPSDGSNKLPQWVLVAMNSVMKWPTPPLPGETAPYKGFDKDVFKVVAQYWRDLEAPLIAPELFFTFTQAFLYFEVIDRNSKLDQSSLIKPQDVMIPSSYHMSSKSTENLVLEMSSPARPVDNNPFRRHKTSEATSQVSSSNPFAEYIPTPIPIPGVHQMGSHPLNHYDSSPEENEENDSEYISGSKILNTYLPPNSCFETAFTSKSPKTRIITQQPVDHKRQRSRRREYSPIYVKMDQFRKHPGAKPSNVKTMNQSDHSKSSSENDSPNNNCSELSLPSDGVVPKPRRIKPSLEGLRHIRNKSGGYVNLALSSSLEEINLNEKIKEELDVPSAIETLCNLIKCCKTVDPSPPSEWTELATISSSSISSNISAKEVSPKDSSGDFLRHISGPNDKLFVIQEPPKICGLKSIQGKQLAIDVLQLLLLLLPPEKRQKLSALLDFMETVSANEEVKLHDTLPTKVVVLETLKNVILQPGDHHNDEVVRRLVHFLLQEKHQVLAVPPGLHAEVQDHIDQFQKQEVSEHRLRQQLWQQQRMQLRQRPQEEWQRREEALKVIASGSKSGSSVAQGATSAPPVVVYCEQVSAQQFEQQKCTVSQQALYELLEQIINDPKMVHAEKNKRLEMFKASYPHIYKQRFPHGQELPVETKPKKLFRLSSLSRLKNMRL